MPDKIYPAAPHTSQQMREESREWLQRRMLDEAIKNSRKEYEWPILRAAHAQDAIYMVGNSSDVRGLATSVCALQNCCIDGTGPTKK